jgi:hypothetical protein
MNITKETVEKTLQLAEYFQNDCHSLTKAIIAEKPNVSVQDATNVWLFKKLADFEMRLRELEDAE